MRPIFTGRQEARITLLALIAGQNFERGQWLAGLAWGVQPFFCPRTQNVAESDSAEVCIPWSCGQFGDGVLVSRSGSTEAVRWTATFR